MRRYARAGGDQSKTNKILITFGENHINDIQVAFEYIALNSAAVPALKSRPRICYMLTSGA